MKRLATAAALWMFCSAASCEERRVVEHLPTPPERLICERAGTRPEIPPEYAIDWSRVTTVAEARAEHERYVGAIRTREGIIVGYIQRVEGVLFTCWTNMQWRRDYEAGIVRQQP